MQPLNNKVVLITGGSTGIGLATAKAFLDNGAKVMIAARRKEEGGKALDSLRQISRDVHFIQADVSKNGDVEQLVSETVHRFGQLDIAFNNAGIEGKFLPVDELSEADFEQVFDINVKGLWLCCKYEIAQFKRQGTGGVIVNTSSWLARGAFPGSCLYSASKAALDGLVRVLAVEGGPLGIRANNIQPGYIQTPMLDRFFPNDDDDTQKAPLKKHAPMGRFCQPEEVAEAVVWLSSPSASFITGESILVDGGLSIAGQRL
ncbi:MAG TPA: glucose 1-dehydrogenase [Chitinophagaceae bacterium]|nr:glucose 1-dehydrogenase [Chitinophagaceae bacterium]